MIFEDKTILVTGGTGSLGQTVVRHLHAGDMGKPAKIIVFSRDEAKQHYVRLSYLNRKAATDEIIYRNSEELLSFHLGDNRNYSSLLRAVGRADVMIHAAALKQVPTCEYFPVERDGYYVICPMLPELVSIRIEQSVLVGEYSSANVTLDQAGLHELLAPYLSHPSLEGIST